MQKTTHPYLYVDDVRCNGVSITAISATDPIPSTGNTPTSSTSVKPTSSAGATPTSSAGVNPPASSSSIEVVVTDLLVIDDFEDGDEVAATTGTWYAYNDKEPGGLSTITNVYDPALPGYVVNLTAVADPTNGTAGFAGLTGIVWNQGTYEEAPFVALGLNTMADTSKGYDFSQCSGLSYRYKGAKHVFKLQDGNVTDWAFHQVKADDAAEWTTVTFSWSQIKQPSWTKEPKELDKAAIKKMAWEVVGYKGFEMQPTYDYLYVDDLKCVSGTIGVKTIASAPSSIGLSIQGKALNVSISKSSSVKVQIFDMMGHVVKNVNENMTAGNHLVSLENMKQGSYVVRVMSNNSSKTARFTIK
ncbi:MAG: CIA30 family protein [Fibrobacteraceae bacterium]|nr:CIA30 family protein [Fibrobacteraceae bacterium]